MNLNDLSPEAREFLSNILPPIRDPGTGLLKRMSEHSAKRRGGSYNFREIVSNWIEVNGGAPEDVLIEVFQCLMVMMRRGDMNAAKLLLERFCGRETETVDIKMAVETMSDTERAARITAIVNAARARTEPPGEIKTAEHRVLPNPDKP